MIVNRSMTSERRAELVTRWRQRADQLDACARRCRSEGDVREAQDAEASAVEYRAEADALETTTQADTAAARADEPDPAPQHPEAGDTLIVGIAPGAVADGGTVTAGHSNASCWWCRRCGRWEVCDSTDLCVECAYVAGSRGRSRTSARAARSA
jgi:hypothetical protein